MGTRPASHGTREAVVGVKIDTRPETWMPTGYRLASLGNHGVYKALPNQFIYVYNHGKGLEPQNPHMFITMVRGYSHRPYWAFVVVNMCKPYKVGELTPF